MLWLLPERRKTEAFLTVLAALWRMGEQNEDTSFLPSLIPLSPKTKEGKFARVEMERRAARRGACAVQCATACRNAHDKRGLMRRSCRRGRSQMRRSERAPARTSTNVSGE